MDLFKSNQRVIICLVGVFLILSYLAPVNAKTNEEIYQEKLAQLKPDDVNGYYQLGVWCKQNKLPEQAKTQFNKVLELDPKHKKARQDLASIIQATQDAKTAEIIKKYGPYKDVLDKPGANKERLPWEKAREKETEHFIVRTNLSVDVLNDICCLLECAYFAYQDIFGFDTPKEKLRVMVLKNSEEYQKIYYDLTSTNPPAGTEGYFLPESDPRNKSRQNHLLSFYNQSNPKNLISMLLHECAHYALRSIEKKYDCSQSPTWLDEGCATYYEASIFEGKRFVTDVISQSRLLRIKEGLHQQTYIKLKDFINFSQREHTTRLHCAQGWSLTYFLLNGQDGKYKSGLQIYTEAWEKGKFVTVLNDGNLELQDKATHLKLFEECMGVSIDQLEKEWKEYILKLN